MSDTVYKSFQLKNLDKAEGLVEAQIGELSVKDREGDIFLPNSIGNQKVLIVDWGHKRQGAPVGKGLIYEESDKILLRGNVFMDDNPEGQKFFNSIEDTKDIAQWSLSFLPERYSYLQDGGFGREFSKVYAYETSPVIIGAAKNSHTISTKSLNEKLAKLDRLTIVANKYQEELANID